MTRTQGRPSDVGRTGIVERICGDVIGSAGDILIIVRESDGGTFMCYDRQLASS